MTRVTERVRVVSTRSMVVCVMAESVEAIDMFKVWVRGKIHYNGRLKNANKMARIQPLYQGFVRDTAEF